MKNGFFSYIFYKSILLILFSALIISMLSLYFTSRKSGEYNMKNGKYYLNVVWETSLVSKNIESWSLEYDVTNNKAPSLYTFISQYNNNNNYSHPNSKYDEISFSFKKFFMSKPDYMISNIFIQNTETKIITKIIKDTMKKRFIEIYYNNKVINNIFDNPATKGISDLYYKNNDSYSFGWRLSSYSKESSE